MHQINAGGINIDVVLKKIKNLHLTVLSPLGKVKISAPQKMKFHDIRIFVLNKLNWIKKQQEKILSRTQKTEKKYITNEEHYFFGKKYYLNIILTNKKPNIELVNDKMIVNVKINFTQAQIKNVLHKWYRSELKIITQQLIAKWEIKMNVQIADVQIRQMKNRWGSCYINKKKIIINFELAKKPTPCLEYVVVHEMVHLFERKHNDRFKNYMNYYLPDWKIYKQQLNSNTMI